MKKGDCKINRKVVDAKEVKSLESGLIPCLHRGQEALMEALRRRYDIDITVPDAPIRVNLKSGDSIIIMHAYGLPQLIGRCEYTNKEISSADFTFAMYTIE